MGMIRNIFCLLPCYLLLALGGKSQHSTALWDDSRISSIHVTLPADSLDSILANPLGDHYFLAQFIFDDGTARDTLDQVGLRLRGNTSRLAAKKSFKISFNTYQPGRRYQGVKKLNLNGSHNDPTMVREKLFYDVWNLCGMPPRRTTFVQVFINQVYHGLYTCLEELDKDWLSHAFAENDGNLYKCTYPADLVYLGSNPQTYKNIWSSTATGGRAYDLQTNDSLDDYNDLVALIATLDQVPDAQFEADIAQHLDVTGYLKALAIDVATGNWDSYAYNKNNYFLYHHLGTGRFEFITYDTDNSFGVDWVNRDWATRDCADWLSHSEPRPLASKLLAVPNYRAQYYAVLDSITRYITRPDSIFPRIDAMKALIEPYVLADTFRSLDYGYTLNDFHLGFIGTVDQHTPYGIKPFLQTRHTKTLEQLASVHAGESTLDNPIFSVFPNPVSDGELLTLHARGPSKGDLHISLVNAWGQTLQQVDWPSHENFLPIDLSSLPAGKYWLLLKGNKVSKSIGIIRN